MVTGYRGQGQLEAMEVLVLSVVQSLPSFDKCFLPAAKRQGQVELQVEKKRKKGLMDFETLKPLFLVLFGIILSSFEPV